jgi:hypothetical protein
MKAIVSRTATFIASERLGLSPAPAPIAMAPGGATGFCDVISRRTGRRAWRYHYIINASMNIDLERPTLPGILDSDRFGRRQAVLGGLRKTGIPLPVSCASRYNSAAAIGTGSLR